VDEEPPPPLLSYATPPSPTRPEWVKLGLLGVPNRLSALIYFWFCIAGAIASAVLTVALHPYWAAGVLLIGSALWYWASIRWMDRHQAWPGTGK
jgi:hypothetical protein